MTKNIILTLSSIKYAGKSIGDDIRIETNALKRCLILHTATDTFTYHKSLKHILGILPDFFIQCHRCYIVNVNYIKKIESHHKVIFKRDKFCYVSEKYFAPLVIKFKTRV